jgi:hypothetical protein
VAVKLHADLRIDRAHFGFSGWLPDLLNCALLVRRIDASLPVWSGLNMRNAAHPNHRLPLLAMVGRAQAARRKAAGGSSRLA